MRYGCFDRSNFMCAHTNSDCLKCGPLERHVQRIQDGHKVYNNQKCKTRKFNRKSFNFEKIIHRNMNNETKMTFLITVETRHVK